jgi:hypothetical protein
VGVFGEEGDGFHARNEEQRAAVVASEVCLCVYICVCV